MKKRTILTAILLLITTSCGRSNGADPDEKIVLQVVLGDFSDTLKSKGFFLSGFGGGINHCSVPLFSGQFLIF